MRLLRLRDNGDFSLTEHVGDPPPYAILSHTWGADDDEVTFKDLSNGQGKEKPGFRKLLFCGQQAILHGLEYFWIDTCCIDKSSSAELSEAINCMFRWYSSSAKCFVYLTDVSTAIGYDLAQWLSDFKRSRWFIRGWTLQELIAPSSVEFFSCEGQLLGDKSSLVHTLQAVTGIADNVLHGCSLDALSVEERFSWATKRVTKREEDAAYSLFGLFDVHMTLIYGEGREKAFKRLHKEIEESRSRGTLQKSHNDHQRQAGLEQLRQWLSAADPTSNYDQALKQRQDATGAWLLSSNQYLTWKTDPASFLWLYGIPGSGKTILSSTIIEDILLTKDDNEGYAVTYFYFNFNDPQKQTAESLLKSLVWQLLQQFDDLPTFLDEWYSLHGDGRRQPTEDSLMQVIHQLMQTFAQVYIILDALDECSQRDKLMQVCSTIGQLGLLNSHIIATSRRERDIEIILAEIGSPESSMILECGLVDEDIRRYVRQRLSEDKALSKWAKGYTLRKEIESALMKGSQGM
jgi:hypothetical protein